MQCECPPFPCRIAYVSFVGILQKTFNAVRRSTSRFRIGKSRVKRWRYGACAGEMRVRAG